jgi:hypothetical protein
VKRNNDFNVGLKEVAMIHADERLNEFHTCLSYSWSLGLIATSITWYISTVSFRNAISRGDSWCVIRFANFVVFIVRTTMYDAESKGGENLCVFASDSAATANSLSVDGNFIRFLLAPRELGG